jgi:hypothetical protein
VESLAKDPVRISFSVNVEVQKALKIPGSRLRRNDKKGAKKDRVESSKRAGVK